MKRIKHLSLHLMAVGFLLLSQPSSVFAQTERWNLINSKCVGEGDLKDVATLKGIECLFQNILSLALQALGIVMFVMLLVGGIKYLTAGEDPKALEAAKGTLTSGVIGLVMAILAWFVLLLIGQFTGIDLTGFTFGI